MLTGLLNLLINSIVENISRIIFFSTEIFVTFAYGDGNVHGSDSKSIFAVTSGPFRDSKLILKSHPAMMDFLVRDV
jgi:hypothetical protein